MRESLGLFKSLQNLGIFRRVNIHILLNKVDIFQRTISKIPISDYFPEYTGGADCFNACKFFADKFLSISNFREATTNVFPISAVDAESVLDVSSCIRQSSERYLGSCNRLTAWSWAAMDPDFSRERRDYMKTEMSGDQEPKPLRKANIISESSAESSANFDKDWGNAAW